MFAESQLLPISALQHLLFCERQAALIHIERIWTENRLTVEGRQLHEKAHDGPDETRDGVRIARGVVLRSFRLGLFGVADVVEFHRARPRDGDPQDDDPQDDDPQDDDPRDGDPREGEAPAEPRAQAITNSPANTTRHALIPFPVEYKRGRPKHHDADRVQLCAQALCLEEMLDCDVLRGALFYGKTRRREPVELDLSLRSLTQSTAARLHEMIASGRTPTARYEKRKCDRCSLRESCLPEATGVRKSVSRYITRAIASADASTAEPQ